jgi:type I restriction enzyme R subunit
VLEALLAKYQDGGVVDELADVKILQIPPFSAMGTPMELLHRFGGYLGVFCHCGINRVICCLLQKSCA